MLHSLSRTAAYSPTFNATGFMHTVLGAQLAPQSEARPWQQQTLQAAPLVAVSRRAAEVAGQVRTPSAHQDRHRGHGVAKT